LPTPISDNPGFLDPEESCEGEESEPWEDLLDADPKFREVARSLEWLLRSAREALEGSVEAEIGRGSKVLHQIALDDVVNSHREGDGGVSGSSTPPLLPPPPPLPNGAAAELQSREKTSQSAKPRGARGYQVDSSPERDASFDTPLPESEDDDESDDDDYSRRPHSPRPRPPPPPSHVKPPALTFTSPSKVGGARNDRVAGAA
jgi:hypothetical protein